MAGLLDGDRPGRPPVYGHDDVLLLVKTVAEDPPDNALVWSVDEKTGIQAKSRVNPTRPAVPATGEGEDATPGIPVRREFEYRRNGTAKLFAAFNVHEGTVAGWVTDSTRSENFVAFLQDLVYQTPAGMQLHCIVDNLSAHGTPLVEEFLDRPNTATSFCTTRLPTPAGSTRSSCGSRSWSVG